MKQPTPNEKTVYAIDRKKRDEMIKKIDNDLSYRRRLRNTFAKLTEAETNIVFKIYNRYCIYLRRKENLNIEHQTIFLFSVLFFQTYKRRFIKQRYKVEVLDKEKQPRKHDGRKRTAREKMLFCIEEIVELKNMGYTYNQIRAELKKDHRAMFWEEPLHPRSIKRVYLEHINSKEKTEENEKICEDFPIFDIEIPQITT